jgi:hypothetical protein
LAGALVPHGALVEDDADSTFGASSEGANTLALARDLCACCGDVGHKTGAQPLRHGGETLAPTFDIYPQQLRSEPAGDARKQHAMNLRIGMQAARESGGGKIEPLPRQSQDLIGIGQRPSSRP